MICVKIGLSLKKCGLREILSCSTTQKLICNAITWSKLDQVVVDSKHVNWWKITQRLVIYHHISSLVVHDNYDGYNNIEALIFLVGSFCKMYLKNCKEYFVVNPCFIGEKIAKKKRGNLTFENLLSLFNHPKKLSLLCCRLEETLNFFLKVIANKH